MHVHIVGVSIEWISGCASPDQEVTVTHRPGGKEIQLIRSPIVNPVGGAWTYTNGNRYRWGRYAEESYQRWLEDKRVAARKDERRTLGQMPSKASALVKLGAWQDVVKNELERLEGASFIQPYYARTLRAATANAKFSQEEVKRLRKLALKLNRENNALREKTGEEAPAQEAPEYVAELLTEMRSLKEQKEAPKPQVVKRVYVVSSVRTFVIGWICAAVTAAGCLLGYYYFS